MAKATRTVNDRDRSKKGSSSKGKKPGPQPLFTDEQVLEALKLSGGILEGAAQILKVSRPTISKYVERSELLQEGRREVKERTKDICESKLMTHINNGNLTAILFFLKTQAKDRGYTERAEFGGVGGGAIKVIIQGDDANL